MLVLLLPRDCVGYVVGKNLHKLVRVIDVIMIVAMGTNNHLAPSPSHHVIIVHERQAKRSCLVQSK